MIIFIQFTDEINKELGNEKDAYKAEEYRWQKAEKGKFFEISVSKINLKKNKVNLLFGYFF